MFIDFFRINNKRIEARSTKIKFCGFESGFGPGKQFRRKFFRFITIVSYSHSLVVDIINNAIFLMPKIEIFIVNLGPIRLYEEKTNRTILPVIGGINGSIAINLP